MRMILDCRRSNLWTGEGLANLKGETGEVGDGDGLWLGQADVLAIAWECQDFSRGISAILAEELKMVEEVVDGVELWAGDVVYPLAKSGFRFESVDQQAGLLLRDPASTMVGLSNGVRFVRHYVNYDNLGDEVVRVLSEVTYIFGKLVWRCTVWR